MHGYFKRSKFVISYSLSKLATVDLFSFSKKVHFVQTTQVSSL